MLLLNITEDNLDSFDGVIKSSLHFADARLLQDLDDFISPARAAHQNNLVGQPFSELWRLYRTNTSADHLIDVHWLIQNLLHRNLDFACFLNVRVVFVLSCRSTHALKDIVNDVFGIYHGLLLGYYRVYVLSAFHPSIGFLNATDQLGVENTLRGIEKGIGTVEGNFGHRDSFLRFLVLVFQEKGAGLYDICRGHFHRRIFFFYPFN